MGLAKAANELEIPANTLYGWMRATREGMLNISSVAHTQDTALTLTDELAMLRKQVKCKRKKYGDPKKKMSFWKQALFSLPSVEGCRNQRLRFIAIKTEGDILKDKLAFYCRMLEVSKQSFYKYLKNKDHPWRYQSLAEAIMDILTEDEYNDTYERIQMHEMLLLKQPKSVHIQRE